MLKDTARLTSAGQTWVSCLGRQLSETRNAERWLTKSSKVFLIGSCFASNFSRWLTAQGSSVIPSNWGLHYNSATIREELEKALQAGRPQVTWATTNEIGTRCYWDAQRHPIVEPTAELLEAKRLSITKTVQDGLRAADAYVITLGLGEIWEQYVNGVWVTLNRAPLVGVVDALRNSIRNRFQTVDEIKSDISRIVQIIHSIKGLKIPIVFTISPIPLKTTGAQYDPRIANTRSKSTIVAAIHQYLDEHSYKTNITPSYFPAFEMTQYSTSDENIWQPDGRHIKANKINEICLQFTKIYGINPAEFHSIPNFDVPEVV